MNGAFIQRTISRIVSVIRLSKLVTRYVLKNFRLEEVRIIGYVMRLIFIAQYSGSMEDLILNIQW